MEVVRLSALSREQVRFPVYADANGVPVDMSDYNVEAAFMTGGDSTANPEAGDWVAGSWETTVTGNWVAGIEVGPGSTVGALASGVYRCWLRVTSVTPGVAVVRLVGSIIVK